MAPSFPTLDADDDDDDLEIIDDEEEEVVPTFDILPTIFQDLVFAFENDHLRSKYERYVIEFGGSVCNDGDSATHFVWVNEVPVAFGKCIAVSPQWLEQCIREKKLY